jgi:2'-5' RNA ligase
MASGAVPGETKTERLFLALTLPEPVRDALLPLPKKVSGLAWTPPEQWHVTLRFLGDVPADRMETLIQRLGMIRVEPFILPVEGVGTFPPNRPPRVLWVGIGSGHPRLFQLRQRVDDAVLAAGIDADLRSFHPHVTLARCNEDAGAGLQQWLHSHRDFAAPPFRVDAFDLYASDLRPSGAVHTLKHRFPLAP